MAEARSQFHAGTDVEVRFVRHNDNSHVAVDVWAIKFGERFFTANIILPHTAPSSATWLIGSIATLDGNPVWGYKDDPRVQAGFSGLAFPFVHDNITNVVFQTKGATPKVAHAVPITDLLQTQEPMRPLNETIARKRAIANALGIDVYHTPTETLVIKHLLEQKRAAEALAQKAEYERKLAERQKKIALMLAREHVTVIAGGRSVSAIWVVGDEWKHLPKGTVVIAGRFDDQKKFWSEETFEVYKKEGQEAEKRYRAVVGLPGTRTTEPSGLPEPVTTKVIMVDGDAFSVPTFASKDDIEAHRKAGLNGGALRAVQKGTSVELFRVTKDKLVPETTFQVIA